MSRGMPKGCPRRRGSRRRRLLLGGAGRRRGGGQAGGRGGQEFASVAHAASPPVGPSGRGREPGGACTAGGGAARTRGGVRVTAQAACEAAPSPQARASRRVGLVPRGLVGDRRDDHQLVGLRARDHVGEPGPQGLGAAHVQAVAAALDLHPFAVGIRVGQRLGEARQRPVLAPLPPQRRQPRAGRQPLGLRVRGGADRRHRQDRVGLRAEPRRPEPVPVVQHRRLRGHPGEVLGEAEAAADLAGEAGAVIGGAEQEDRRQRHARGARLDPRERVTFREAAVPEQQFLQAVEEVVPAALPRGLAAAQRPRGEAVRARRPAEAEIDAAREQGLQHPEALGHHQRRVVRQHDPARADPEVAGRGGDLADHDLGGRARHVGQGVVLGEPVAPVAEAVDVAGERQGVVQGPRRGGLGADEGEVEDGERGHGQDLVTMIRQSEGGRAGEPCAARRARASAACCAPPCRLSVPGLGSAAPQYGRRPGIPRPLDPEHRTPWLSSPTSSRG